MKKTIQTMKKTFAMGTVIAVGLSLAACQSSDDKKDAGSANTTAASGAPKLDAKAVKTAGTVVICTDPSSPPTEYYDENHKLVGSDIEIGDAMGGLLGLDVKWRQTGFASLIPTLLAEHCDVAISDLYINEERLEVVDMIHYFNSGASVIVTTSNPHGVTGLDNSLCGLTVSSQSGTTSQKGARKQATKCETAGLKKMSLLSFKDEVGTIKQLSLGRADAVAMSSESAGYLMTKTPGKYEFAGEQSEAIPAGITVKKGNGSLVKALEWAFGELRSSGKYTQILEKHGVQQGAVE